MILGIDVSTYLEQQKLTKQKFTKNHQEVDPFVVFKANGVSHIRLRIWNDPYDENGEPYLGGTCDTNSTIELYNDYLKKYGFKYLIDFHYSDFWTDPIKQFAPKAWLNLSFPEVVEALYKFTKESLTKILKAGMDVDMIQIGNEITNGMCYPFAQLTHDDKRKEVFKRLTSLLKSGIKAAKEVFPNAKIIIHLERAYDKVGYHEYLSELKENNVQFDILGTSYYPFWHHSFEEYFSCQDMVRKEFGVKVMNVEVGYPFTLDDYRKESIDGVKHLVINADNIQGLKEATSYSVSKEGQAEFIREFLRLCKEHHFEGACYWEPLWVPGENICWTSKGGQIYQKNTSKDTRNEWANQCLFDYDAEANPAVDEYKL